MKDERAMVVMTTVEDDGVARAMAAALVEQGFAACVSWHPVNSVYRWEGKIEAQSECLLIVKTRAAHWSAVHARIAELSSYETPEIVGLDVAQISPRYLEWLLESVNER